MEFGPGLQPMAPFREDIVFLRGLYNQQAVASTSPHLGRMPNMLSGATVSLDPSDIRVGTTMDQVLSQQIGNQTAVPSLVLGIEPNELRLEDGLSMIYGSSHFLGFARQTRHQGNLSGPRVRPAGRRRQRPEARPQHSRRGAQGDAAICSRGSAAATAESSTNTWSRSATSRSASTMQPARSAWKAGDPR